MAVTRVTAQLDNDMQQMNALENDRYGADLTAPIVSGDYSVEIRAYDDAGNVGISNADNNPDLLVEVTKWHTPKVNWTASDSFNMKDYNRILNNLLYLHEEASKLWKPFDIEDMGEEIWDNRERYNVKYFNAWEKNVEIINNVILTQNYGFPQTFYQNGAFISPSELNRIEGAILSMRGILDRQKLSFRKLSFRLGNFKGVRI